jgi:hypothetical protein
MKLISPFFVFAFIIFFAYSSNVFIYSQPLEIEDMHEVDDFSLDALLNLEIEGQEKYNNIIKQSTNSILIITADEMKKLGFTTLRDVMNFATDYYFSYDGS